MNNSDMPAVPISNSKGFPTLEGRLGGKGEREIIGLTKREYFAGLALQGLLANSVQKSIDDETISNIVLVADALLKELDK